jgi:hypothetical protein
MDKLSTEYEMEELDDWGLERIDYGQGMTEDELANFIESDNKQNENSYSVVLKYYSEEKKIQIESALKKYGKTLEEGLENILSKSA